MMKLLLLLIVALTQETVTAQDPCRVCPGWKKQQGVLGYLNIFENNKLNYDTAQNYCENCGGYLLVLDTPEKIAQIKSNADVTKGRRYWVGANDRSGSWEWPTTGTRITRTKGQDGWVHNNPNDDEGDDTCMMMAIEAGGVGGIFHDRACVDLNNFICQAEA